MTPGQKAVLVEETTGSIGHAIRGFAPCFSMSRIAVLEDMVFRGARLWDLGRAARGSEQRLLVVRACELRSMP
jgi:hypothetical protein